MPVTRLDEFIAQYAEHPESKAAGPDGLPATSETRGLLGRLHLTDGRPSRIGKEIDRLDEDDGERLERDEPFAYDAPDDRLEWALRVLDATPRAGVAHELGISVRALQDILKGRATPRPKLRPAIVRLAIDMGLPPVVIPRALQK